MFAQRLPQNQGAMGHPAQMQQDAFGYHYPKMVSQMDSSIRSDFVRKVYGILSVQLLLTGAIGAAFHAYMSPAWAVQHMLLFHMAGIGAMVLLIGMACCCPQAGRTFPTNYWILFALTILLSVNVGFAVTLYTGTSVLMAVGATALVFLGLTAFACLTKTDFTGFGPYLYAALMCMMSFSFIMWVCTFFGPLPPGLRMAYAFCGVLLFSFYIVYDTQLIVGGRHSHKFDIDDYVFAALNIYLDIINLFMYLLELFGERR